MSQERDCNLCDNHSQATAIPPLCDACLSSRSIQRLPFWTPIKDPMSKAYDAAFRTDNRLPIKLAPKKEASDGSTAGYYELPEGAKELQDLISYKNMNAQMGEIFRAVYRYGQVGHSPEIRDIKKIIFYANEELKRLEKYVQQSA